MPEEASAMVDIKEIAERAVRDTMKFGPSDCDVAVTDSTFLAAEIEKGSMKQSSSATDPGVSIRAFVKGCAGFSFCTGFEPDSIKKSAELAVSQARAGTPDPDFSKLPDKLRPSKVPGLFDPRVARLSSDEVVNLAIELADLAGDDRRISSVNASIGLGLGSAALANSRGFSGLQKFTFFDAGTEVVAKEGSTMFSGVDSESSRKFDRRAVRRIASKAKEHAIMGLKQTKIKTGDYPVVIDPIAFGFILSTAVGDGTNAEGIQRKRSYLAGKLGEGLGNEMFSVTDDPTIEWGTGSYSFDGEGVPAKKKPVFDGGVLKSYLYDSYTAGKDGVESTGNCSRGGSLWSFRRPPGISSSNLVFRKGRSSLDEMVSETRKGVYLRITYDYPNLATGEFSGLMMESYAIEKGGIGPALKQSTIGVSLFDLMKRIDIVGKDVREAYGVVTPSVRISSAKIAGSA